MLKTINIKDLTPYDKNPRINDKAVDRVLHSLNENGYIAPIIVSEVGFPFGQHVICAGHTRYKALKKFGAKEVQCFVHKFDTEEAFVRYNIQDNKTSEFAEWDETILEELSSQFDIDLKAMDFEFTGNESDDHLLDGLTDPDDVPEAPEEPVAKLGHIWKLGEHRLMCGDSTDRAQVERLMGGEKADVCLTDPPYGIDVGNQSQGKGGGVAKSIDYGVNDWDKEIPYGFLDIAYAFSDSQIYWGANYYADKLKPSPCWIVWDKDNGETDFADVEMAWCSLKKSARLFKFKWSGMLQEDMKNKEKRVHPTQKPSALSEWCLDKFNFGKLVLDLFGGSGSTLIACEKTGRKCRMMELDNRYVDVIIQRWCDFTGIYNIECDGKPYEWKSKK